MFTTNHDVVVKAKWSPFFRLHFQIDFVCMLIDFIETEASNVHNLALVQEFR